MGSSNYTYLEEEFPLLYNIGQSAEYYIYSDPAICISKLRSLGEKITEILFEKHALDIPKINSFHNRLKILEFEGILPEQVKDLLFLLKRKGNSAVHDNSGTLVDAKSELLSAFKISKWFYETYSSQPKDLSSLRFDYPENLDSRHALSL